MTRTLAHLRSHLVSYVALAVALTAAVSTTYAAAAAPVSSAAGRVAQVAHPHGGVKAGPRGPRGKRGKSGPAGAAGPMGVQGSPRTQGPSGTGPAYEAHRTTTTPAPGGPVTLSGLPAGSYLITAKAVAFGQSGSSASAVCYLDAGPDRDIAITSVAVNDYQILVNQLVHTYATTGAVVLTCTSSTALVSNATVIATRVQSATSTAVTN